jgi:predicted nucleotidyltransferase
MTNSFDTNREEIAAACERYGIERLYVFGSALREDFRVGESDIDLLVEFGPVDITKKFHNFLDARKAFTQIFRAEVDLVMHGAVKNKIIANEIDRTKRLLYGT